MGIENIAQKNAERKMKSYNEYTDITKDKKIKKNS